MIKIKAFVLDETNWLEATWVNESDEQVYCESYSGHPEHITMLRAKALEFRTPLDEYEGLIVKAEQAYTPPTQEELDAELVKQKRQEYSNYLNSTDYYYPRFLETGEPVPEDVVLKRKEARDFLRANPIGA